jgi:hypothetical protein
MFVDPLPTKPKHLQVGPSDLLQNGHILLKSKSGRPVKIQVKKMDILTQRHDIHLRSKIDISYLDVLYRGLQ